jgi:hypothetical protein
LHVLSGADRLLFADSPCQCNAYRDGVSIHFHYTESHQIPSSAQTHIAVVDTAGSVAGLTETALIPYINTELNGTNTGSRAPYALSSHASTDVSSLQDQVKNGNLDILLVIARAPIRGL